MYVKNMRKEKILNFLRKSGIFRFGTVKWKVKSSKELPPPAYMSGVFSKKDVAFNLDKKKKKRK